MYSPIGKHVGRGVLRSGCHRIPGGSGCTSTLTRHFGSRVRASRIATSLDLPALDKKWQSLWQMEQQHNDNPNSPRSAVKRKAAEFKPEVEQDLQGKADLSKGRTGAATRKVADGKAGKYVLPMFPYPSGDLHLGHLRVYTISDVLARFRRMQGYDVMHPIGWDAFGLPAENAAIDRGIDPAVWTKQNIEKMKSQLETMNGHWDWNREFATCDPTFYKHTQQLFLMLHKAGLAYQAESWVNYDPVDKTVLANEQVDSNGYSWRSGAKVEKKMLKQWFLKISEFRQELLDGLAQLEKNKAWPERVLAMQKNWLGKSTGARIKFPVVAYDQQTHSDIEVFTTRPDTLFGVQYVALASTHPIVKHLAKADVELQAFLDTIPALPQDSKVGYLLPHIRALNPLSYDDSTPEVTKASLPIYVAPYVLGDYGDGAVMGVPGHDTRDHSFWKHNRYDDPIRVVISQSPDEATSVLSNEPYVHHGHLTEHNGQFAGLTSPEANKKIVALLESKKLGSVAETWRLRDWLVSRQRYWGTPIPIIHCDSCGPVPVPDDQLPVELPAVDSHWAQGKAGNPLEHAHGWINTTCPECGGAAKRDTDTMDTFVDSSWYFMRFPDPHNKESLFSPEAANSSLPVDLYVGGVEHAILHLLYARFISKFMATSPLWPEGSKHLGEPFKKVLAQGMVHGRTYSDPSTGRFLKPDEVDLTDPTKPIVVATKEIANISFEKMSKSKYNGVDPGTCIAKYGADATRAHILFQAPVSEVLEWDEEKIAGITRWLSRLHGMIIKSRARWLQRDWNSEFNPKLYFMHTQPPRDVPRNMIASEQWLTSVSSLSQDRDLEMMLKGNGHNTAQEAMKGPKQDLPRDHMLMVGLQIWKQSLEEDKKLWSSVQSTIANVTNSYSKTYSLNTVVSDLMALTNTIMDYNDLNFDSDNPTVHRPDYRLSLYATRALVQMMAPITPAFAEECWQLISMPQVTRYDRFRYHISSTRRWLFLQVKLIWYRVRMLVKHGTWVRVMGNTNQELSIPDLRPPPGSIFKEEFPTVDGTLEMLMPDKQKCAVQINGKVRCVVDISKPEDGLTVQELETWILKEILRTKEGEEKLMGAGAKAVDIRKAKKIVVVKGGKTVNFVV